MTRLQAAMLAAIDRMTIDGIPPSYAELQRAFDLASVSNVSRVVTALKRDGFVTFEARRPRSLRVLKRLPAGAVFAGYLLRPEIEEALSAYCMANGVHKPTIINEAVAAYLGVEVEPA